MEYARDVWIKGKRPANNGPSTRKKLAVAERASGVRGRYARNRCSSMGSFALSQKGYLCWAAHAIFLAAMLAAASYVVTR